MPILAPMTLHGSEPMAYIRPIADDDRSQTQTAHRIELRLDPSAFWQRNLRGQRARRELEVIARSQSHLRSLEVDPPNEFSIRSARLALKLFEVKGLNPSSLSISMDGGVAMSFVAGNNRAFLEFCNSEEIVAACYSELGATVVWQLQENQKDLSEAAIKIRVHLAS